MYPPQVPAVLKTTHSGSDREVGLAVPSAVAAAAAAKAAKAAKAARAAQSNLLLALSMRLAQAHCTLGASPSEERNSLVELTTPGAQQGHEGNAANTIRHY